MYTKLDFKYLSELAKTNPEKFEEVRAKEIEKAIQGASKQNQQRLRGLQFQVDAKRQIHKDSPVGSCLEISKMMHESFENLRYQLNLHLNKQDPLGNVNAYTPSNNEAETSATVLAFRN